ncbi:uncharacterized protein LOC111402859 [Olea europaea var. sylvestris]|uniref:uncharacterized protein LOC111402859 n=1 Tax=Olea europaea var. sylvestris TaxID=158386 RepID=UPI000C1D2601|nr:uncharacterized protein LOC111402859 [Olea europaea var. sylvestris]
MAAFAPTSQAADLLQKLSLDTQAKTLEIPEPTKKPSFDSGNVTAGHNQSRDGSLTPMLSGLIDQSMCYLPNGYPSTAYYYGGYDGTGSEWKDYTPYVNSEGVEVTPGVYGDNGSLMYHHGYGYAPYGPYSPATTPIPTVGHDGQLYEVQHCQYHTPFFQSATSGPYPTPAASTKGDISASAAADQASLSVATADAKSHGTANSGSIKKNNCLNAAKPTYPNSSYGFNGMYG